MDEKRIKPAFRPSPDAEAVAQAEAAKKKAQAARAASLTGEVLDDYYVYNFIRDRSQYFDLRNVAATPAGANTTLLTYRTRENARGVIKKYGVGYAAGSAQGVLWDFRLQVNGQPYPLSENLTTFSIPSPSAIDRDLLEIFIAVPPASTVELYVINPAAGVNMTLWGRIVGFYTGA